MTRAIINEATQGFLTVTCLDQDGVEAAPSTLHWTVHDIASGTEVKAETAVSGPAAVNVIDLAPAIQAILDPRLKLEGRQVTVISNKGDAVNEARGFYKYYVRNLAYGS